MGIKIRFKEGVRPEAKEMAERIAREYWITDPAGESLIETFADAYTTELNGMEILCKEGLTFKEPKVHTYITDFSPTAWRRAYIKHMLGFIRIGLIFIQNSV